MRSLLVTIGLLGSWSVAQAISPGGFNVHADLFVKPYYDVVISSKLEDGKYILAADAAKILADAKNVNSEKDRSVEYELMALRGHDYLCSIPRQLDPEPASSLDLNVRTQKASSGEESESVPYEVLPEKPIENSPQHPLAPSDHLETDVDLPAESVDDVVLDDDEIKSKAVELLRPLDGTCLYYTFSYWTYAVCYGRDIVQFHAGPVQPDKPPEPKSGEPYYVLGRFLENSSDLMTVGNLEGAVFASQILGNGTECDLTGADRSVEVQYFCSMKSPIDNIASVRELRTCHYEIVVNSRQLCNDLVFAPPKEPGVNQIHCRRVYTEEELTDVEVPASEPSAIGFPSVGELLTLGLPEEYSNLEIPEDESLHLHYSDLEIVFPMEIGADIEFIDVLEFIRDSILEDIAIGIFLQDGHPVVPEDEFVTYRPVIDPLGKKLAIAQITVKDGMAEVIVVEDESYEDPISEDSVTQMIKEAEFPGSEDSGDVTGQQESEAIEALKHMRDEAVASDASSDSLDDSSAGASTEVAEPEAIDSEAAALEATNKSEATKPEVTEAEVEEVLSTGPDSSNSESELTHDAPVEVEPADGRDEEEYAGNSESTVVHDDL